MGVLALARPPMRFSLEPLRVSLTHKGSRKTFTRGQQACSQGPQVPLILGYLFTIFFISSSYLPHFSSVFLHFFFVVLNFSSSSFLFYLLQLGSSCLFEVSPSISPNFIDLSFEALTFVMKHTQFFSLVMHAYIASNFGNYSLVVLSLICLNF